MGNLFLDIDQSQYEFIVNLIGVVFHVFVGEVEREISFALLHDVQSNLVLRDHVGVY